ncbi:MAG: sigma 54-interacting transcriptional regulator [Clostridia bacterium]|nr:sigma 54-interacting transcriptional regulator [Clostridia bacterium]
MLFEKSLVDKTLLKTVVDPQVKITSLKNFDINNLLEDCIDGKYKLVLIIDKNRCGVLNTEDLMFMSIKQISIHEYMEQKSSWTIPLSDEMNLGEFFSQYENAEKCYFPIRDKQTVYGIVDKNKILSLYKQVDEDNSQLITSILDNIHDAICIVDTKIRVKFWNKSAEKLYGISRETILDQKLTDYFPKALLPEVIQSKRVFSNVYNLPRENAHNLISASPLYNKGVLIGAISYDKDISEQIKIAESLKATETNLQVLKSELEKIGEERYTFENMVGQDPKWIEALKITKMVSKSMLNILISGESGTGKEVLARAIHLESQRKGYFVPINCSAIPKDLFESELFGYASGAFSGASKEGKIGKFEFANKGTLFLDEIGDMPLELQAKLLRVLEDSEVIPIGGNEPIKVDVRVIAASNKDLLKLSNENLFRKDLFYRLNGIGVHLTPLRERPGDIRLLAVKFFEDFKQTYGYPYLELTHDILDLLENYHWEGNIRELKNIIERMVILSKNNGNQVVSDQFLPDVIRNMAIRMKVGPSYSLNDLIEKTEKEAIIQALSKSQSKADAAKLLKIPRSTLYFKMDKYQIDNVSES